MAVDKDDLLRRAFDAFNAEGVDESLAYLDPDITWHAPPQWLEQRVYRGHEGVRELSAYWTQNFEHYRLDLERVIEVGPEQAVALLYQRGRIKESGADVEQAVGYVVEIRDDKLKRIDVYFSWEATLEAAGLEP